MKKKNKLKGCFMHESDHWRTPTKMYEKYMKCGYYDPCPYKCEKFNGLTEEWKGNVFCNPPYSEISKWVDKAIEEHKKDITRNIELLLPVRTDTKWFAKLQKHASKIEFIKGRLHFNNSKSGAPFPSMIVRLYYGNEEGTTNCEIIEQYWNK